MTRIKFFTLGCKVNQYETQVLSKLFFHSGFTVCGGDDGGDADIFVINSCTVTAEGDSKCRKLLRKLRREHPSGVIVLTGCYPQAFPSDAALLPEPDIITGSRNRNELPNAVKQYLATGKRVVSIAAHERTEVFEPMTTADFGKHTRAFIKIEDGCENYCAYCIIPTARGPVRSKPPAELAGELAALATAGHREVVLAGINLSSYGKDIGLRLIDALELACDTEGIDRVRLGSLEPDLITPHDIARMGMMSELCPQFHLSLQSGCDTVLARMGRHYTTSAYMAVVVEIMKHFPHAAITTDLMVGFPGETDEEFIRSVEFARGVGFAKIHVFSYSPREGTRAAAMENQVPQQIKHRRSGALMAVAADLRQEFLAQMVGQRVEVLFEEHPAEGMQMGYTKNYTPVSVAGSGNWKYSIRKVLITGVSGDGCEGIVIDG